MWLTIPAGVRPIRRSFSRSKPTSARDAQNLMQRLRVAVAQRHMPSAILEPRQVTTVWLTSWRPLFEMFQNKDFEHALNRGPNTVGS